MFNKVENGIPFFAYIRTEPVSLEEQFAHWISTRLKDIVRPFGHTPRSRAGLQRLKFFDTVHTIAGEFNVQLVIDNY
jgi:hypothetical protein